MSAFKVTDNHVRLIAYAACSGRYPIRYYWRGKERRLSMSDIDRVCTLLGKENDQSLRARYPQDHKALGTKRAVKITFICASGVISAEDEYDHYGESAGFTFITASGTRRYKPVEVYQAVQCYEYQSCEHDGWSRSEAAAICRSVADRFAVAVIRSAGLLANVPWTY
ncbi:MAG: hypothetical protein E6Q36_01220 [Chryseobacterium sp.]|nr:MAG: hypothetical protein E6Q36_01220 [Chryseobacterium sp.]